MRGALLIASWVVLGACTGREREATSDAPPPRASLTRPALTWPKSDAVDGHALAALDQVKDVRALVARSPVPVLAPRDVALERPLLVVEGEYYALTGRISGATISIQGTRAAHRYEDIPPMPGHRPLRSGRGFVTVNEGIRSASFVEGGTAYSVDVECAAADDARCTQDGFVVGLVDTLVFVGGSGR